MFKPNFLPTGSNVRCVWVDDTCVWILPVADLISTAEALHPPEIIRSFDLELVLIIEKQFPHLAVAMQKHLKILDGVATHAARFMAR